MKTTTNARRTATRVGAYGRASHLNEMSVDSQLRENQAWADREPDWDLPSARVWRDDGISASKYASKGREDWPKVMAAIQAGDLDILLVWEISRASRDRMVFAALFAACEQQDVKIGVAGRLYDLSAPEDAFQLDLMASLAVRESGVTSKRLKRGVRARALEGKPHGKLPMGYRREYAVKADGKREILRQEIEPDAAAVIREIITRALNGEAMHAIARDFNARGVPTPEDYRDARRNETEPVKTRHWYQQQVRRIALDPTYAGKRTHNKVEVGDATWPAIVAEDEHAALTARLTDPSRRTVDDWTPKHLGTGLFRCGKAGCGGSMRRVKARAQTTQREYHSYSCARNHCTARVMWRVDELVREVVIARFERPDARDLFTPDDRERQAALKELKTLTDRLESFHQEAVNGNLTAERFARIEQDLQPKIDAASKSSAPVDLPDEVTAMLDAADGTDGPDGPNVRELWDGLELHQQRRVIRAIVTVVILPKPRGGGANRWENPYVRFDWHHATAPDAGEGEG